MTKFIIFILLVFCGGLVPFNVAFGQQFDTPVIVTEAEQAADAQSLKDLTENPTQFNILSYPEPVRFNVFRTYMTMLVRVPDMIKDMEPNMRDAFERSLNNLPSNDKSRYTLILLSELIVNFPYDEESLKPYEANLTQFINASTSRSLLTSQKMVCESVGYYLEYKKISQNDLFSDDKNAGVRNIFKNIVTAHSSQINQPCHLNKDSGSVVIDLKKELKIPSQTATAVVTNKPTAVVSKFASCREGELKKIITRAKWLSERTGPHVVQLLDLQEGQCRLNGKLSYDSQNKFTFVDSNSQEGYTFYTIPELLQKLSWMIISQ